jgi:hypothetical protein
MTTLEQIIANQGAAYSVAGYSGVAWRFAGVEIGRQPVWECDEFCNQAYDDCCWEDDLEFRTGRVLMVMIGDDRKFTFDPEDCTVIDEEAYCPECGQIGCTAYQGVVS